MIPLKTSINLKCRLQLNLVRQLPLPQKEFLPQAKLRMFDTEPQAYQELRNGNVHAVVGTAPRPAYEAVDYSETLFLPVQGTFTKEPMGFAMRKGDPDTLVFFNSWITIVTLEGWLEERHNYWFGSKDWITGSNKRRKITPHYVV